MAIPPGKTYGEIIKARIQNPRDRKSMREVGREIGYSYEHIRKVVAGELTFTKEFSDAICSYLEFSAADAELMWHLAQTLKMKKRYQGADLTVEMPRDTRVKDIFLSLNATQREAWIQIGESWIHANDAQKRGEDAVGVATSRRRVVFAAAHK